jgi:hypothetical protein
MNTCKQNMCTCIYLYIYIYTYIHKEYSRSLQQFQQLKSGDRMKEKSNQSNYYPSPKRGGLDEGWVMGPMGRPVRYVYMYVYSVDIYR